MCGSADNVAEPPLSNRIRRCNTILDGLLQRGGPSGVQWACSIDGAGTRHAICLMPLRLAVLLQGGSSLLRWCCHGSPGSFSSQGNGLEDLFYFSALPK